MTNNDNRKRHSKGAGDPPLRNYQEQPNATTELEQAIDTIPLKDYSDYEVTIEAKEHYEDALFSDDASLELALTAPQKAIIETQEKESTPDEPPEKTAVLIDYSVFLGQESANETSSQPGHSNSPATQLLLSATTLNGCAVSERTPPTVIKDKRPETLIEPDSNKTVDDIPGDHSLHKKILHWGKKRLAQNKDQLDEYLGRSLPERTLPLEFKFAALKPKKDFEHLVSTYDIGKIFSAKGRLLHTLLKQADEDLGTVAKCQMPNKARLQLLDAYTPQLVEKIRGIRGTQGKTAPFPYEDNRSIAAEHAQNVIKHLINSYKQVYSSLYEAANHIYAPQRKTANRLARQIIDLLCLEQNLAIGLHKPLPVGSAKTFNKLFHALSRYEPETIDTIEKSPALEQEASIRDLFIRYQTLLSFDLATLSSTLYKLLNQYLAENLHLLELLPNNDWNTPPSFNGKAWMVSHNNNGAPALSSVAGSDPFTPVFIRVDVFFNQIKEDYAQSLRLTGASDSSHRSPTLQAVAPHHSLTLMCELNRYINMIESNSAPPSYSNFQPWPGKIYSGFSNSYAWLNHYYGKINQAVTKKGEEAVEIAQKPRAGTTQWLCAMEDQDFLYLQTAERKGTPALDVGCLVLVDAGSEEKIATIMLLHIIRIERIQNNILNVLAKKIGQQSTNILFKNTTAGKSPGIISCYNEQRFLLANATEHFKSGETIEVQLPDQTSATIKIKEINSISQQFQALELE